MFLLANNSIKIILGMSFLTFNNVNIQFPVKKLICKSYFTAKALLISKKVEFINKKKVAKMELDK